MPATDSQNQTPSRARKRLWIVVLVALLIVAAVLVASGALGDFASGFRDGVDGTTRAAPPGSR